MRGSGIAVAGNVSVDPRFVDGPGHDYRLSSDSQFASWQLWDGQLGAQGSQDGSLSQAHIVGLARAHIARRARHHRRHHRHRHHRHVHHRRSP